MPTVNITLDDLISIATASLISNTNAKIALTEGDPLLALLQAGCAADLVLVAAIQSVIHLSRAQTRYASDLDDWMSDFSFPRLQSMYASGDVTVTIDPNYFGSVTIPADGSLQVIPASGAALFKVIANSKHPYYTSVPIPSYVIPAGSTRFTIIPIQALNPGTGSNVAKETLTSFSISVQGVVEVKNEEAISNGKDLEGDRDYLTRFQTMMTSLGAGNEDAIAGAVQSVLGGGSSYVLQEHTDAVGEVRQGEFRIVAENGSGKLTDAEVDAITLAVEKRKAFGIPFTVTSPTLLSLDAQITYLLDPKNKNLQTGAENAIVTEVAGYLNKRKIAQPVLYSELVYRIMRLRIVYPVIIGVETVVIGDKVNEDYTIGSTQVIRSSGVITVSGSEVQS